MRIEYHNSGFYALRSAPGVVATLDGIAEHVASRANEADKTDEYKTGSQQGKRRPQGRWRATVYTAGNHAKRANALRNTLIRALGK